MKFLKWGKYQNMVFSFIAGNVKIITMTKAKTFLDNQYAEFFSQQKYFPSLALVIIIIIM